MNDLTIPIKMLEKLLVLLAVAVGCAVVVCLVAGFFKAKNELDGLIRSELLRSINEEVDLKIAQESRVFHRIYNPNIRTGKPYFVVTKDTIRGYTTRLGRSSDVFRDICQSYLLQVNRLSADTLYRIMQQKLADRNIRITLFIEVSGPAGKHLNHDISGTRISYVTPPVRQGVSGEITYRAYAGYPFLTLLKLMPKLPAGMLVALGGVILSLMLLLAAGKKRKQRDKIIMDPKGNFSIGLAQLHADKRVLTGPAGQQIFLRTQLYDLLMKFLTSPDYSLKKPAILQQFWDGSTSAENSMTTAISRLRESLKESGSGFVIARDKVTGDYRLQPESLSDFTQKSLSIGK